MSPFKKTCYLCGKKVNKLYENKCEECFKEENPPIEDIKPINIKFCNMCGKIHYENSLITKEEFEKKLPKIVEKNLKINKNYILENVEIENFQINGIEVDFDIVVDTKLKKE